MRVINSIPYLRPVAVILVLLVFWLLVKYMTWQKQVKDLPDGTINLIRALPEDGDAAAAGLEKTGHPVQVEVFYEALCPDSKTFIVDQLAPTVARLPPDTLNVILVPYGKAETHKSGSKVTFTCQHAEEECWANKVHACGIKQAANQTVAVQFATCLMVHFTRLKNKGPECAKASRLQWSALSDCADGPAINADMVRYGEMTHGLRPPVTFIPTITVDNSQGDQGEMFGDFLNYVCKAYQARSGKKPAGCP